MPARLIEIENPTSCEAGFFFITKELSMETSVTERRDL